MKLPVWIAIAIAAVFLLFGSVFVVREGHTAVVLNLGKIVRYDLKPGLHFKWPLIETPRIFDARPQVLPAETERYLTLEQKDVSVDYFAIWQIRDSRAFFRATAGNQAGAVDRLAPIIKDALRNEINSRTLSQVVSGARTKLASTQLDEINKATATLGVRIVDLRIKRIDLPEDSRVIDDVYNRMRAQRQQVASKLRAEGEEQANQIRAQADRERTVVLAEAERDAQKLRGEGDAEAARIYGEAANADPSFFAFQRSLEAYRRSFQDGNAVIVLDKDDPFLQYMRSDR
jgi:membrane protease subunit HflC